MLKFFRKNALAVIVITTGILSLIFVHVLPGLYGKVGEERYYIKTLYLAFGGAKMQVTTPDFTTMVAMQGGLSYFGLISVIMNVAGITFAIISIKVRHLTLDYYGAVFMVISGVSMLLLFNSGTAITVESVSIDFVGFVTLYGFELSTGAIVYGIIAIVGALIGIIIEENNWIR